MTTFRERRTEAKRQRQRTAATAPGMTPAERDAFYRQTKCYRDGRERATFDAALRDAQEKQRLELAGLKHVEGRTLDEKMVNAERQVRLNGGAR